MIIHDNKQIVITPCDNGFIVSLPYMQPAIGEEYIQENFEELMRRGTRAAMEEQMKDPILAKIQGEENKTVSRPAQKLKDQKNDLLHVFKTFPEVLKFLKEKMQ